MAGMIVRDPVCGMQFPVERAAASLSFDKTGAHYFCSDRCLRAFRNDPERFVQVRPDSASVFRPESGATEGARTPEVNPDGAGCDHGESSPVHQAGPSTRCPYCGTETGIHREVDPEHASLSLSEMETLVHNEWRRRLGSAAYDRVHPLSLIRALLAYARDPADPERSAALDVEMAAEAATLAGRGLNERQIQAELYRLSQAIWDVLSWTDPRFGRSQELMERMDRKLMHTIVANREARA